MEPIEYKIMFENELSHWWYKGLQQLLFYFVGEISQEAKRSKDDFTILDSGCGTGAILQRLMKYGRAYGLDIATEAIEFCRKRNLTGFIVKASATRLPFKEDSFDLIISSGVLYHMKVENDLGAIAEANRVLNSEGFLIIDVPAFNFIRTQHDRKVHTRHRFKRSELVNKLKTSGFDVLKISYRNSFLLPLILLKLLFGRFLKKRNGSELALKNTYVNRLFFSASSLENKILEKKSIPFGLSLFCLARKFKCVN